MALVPEIVSLVGEVLTICKSITEIVSALNDLRVSSDNFPSEMQSLRARLDLYEGQVKIQRLQVDGSVVTSLRIAKATLQEAETNVKNLKENFDSNTNCCLRGWLYVKLILTCFSYKLDKSIQTVNEQLDKMSKIINEQIEVPILLQQAANQEAIVTRISDNDSRYVPIKGSQASVLKAIEKGPRIVLLYGGVGKGKSTLARHVCELYGESGDRKNMFDYVRLVNCAGSSKLDPSNKQYEILRYLSPTSLSTSESPESGTGDFKVKIAESLKKFFMSGKKIFIILDDVSDHGLISEMWKASEGGTQVKYLVTSQYPNLCDSFKRDSVTIAMGVPAEDEAMTILASLVGLKEKVIPAHLQVC